MFPYREIYCDLNKNKITRFFQHAALGLYPNIQEHNKHWTEKIGDAGLWCYEQMPVECWKTAHNPKVVTVAIAILVYLGITFAFYSDHINYALEKIAIPDYPPWAVSLYTYISLMGITTFFAMRAFGRFCEINPYGDRLD